MPKRPSRTRPGSSRTVLKLAVLTLALFLAGEALILGRSDSGQLLAAKFLPFGDRARITQLVGREVRRGLEAASIPRDSVRESVTEKGPAAVRVRVGLRRDGSPLQVNYALSRSLAE